MQRKERTLVAELIHIYRVYYEVCNGPNTKETYFSNGIISFSDNLSFWISSLFHFKFMASVWHDPSLLHFAGGIHMLLLYVQYIVGNELQFFVKNFQNHRTTS
jgi:hypothetical protein